jgi:hypothetical protein
MTYNEHESFVSSSFHYKKNNKITIGDANDNDQKPKNN